MTMTVESGNVAHGRPIPCCTPSRPPPPTARPSSPGQIEPSPAVVGRAGGHPSFAISVVDPDVPADRTRMGVDGISSGTTSHASISRTGS